LLGTRGYRVDALSLRQDAEAFFSRTPAARAQTQFDFQRLAAGMHPHVPRAFRESSFPRAPTAIDVGLQHIS